MARRSFFDRVRDFLRPAPKQAPPPPPIQPRPLRNQPPPPPRQAPKQVPSRPARFDVLPNYNGWRQVRIQSNQVGDALNFVQGLPSNNYAVIVAYGPVVGDNYEEGEWGWITIQKKDWATDINIPEARRHRRAAVALFAHDDVNGVSVPKIEKLIVRYGSVRTLGDQHR